MEPVWRSARRRAMLARPEFLLAIGVALECKAATPENFAGRPVNQDGCVLGSAERREAERRAVLQRGILGAVGAGHAGVEDAGVSAGAWRAASRGLPPRGRRRGSRDAARRTQP